MQRALCVWLPAWSIELTRRRLERIGTSPDRLLLVTTRAGHQRVARACLASRRAGVRAQMSLAHARALVDAHVEDFTPERDRRVLRSLAMWASRFSPSVGIDPATLTHDAEPDGLIMDISGCDRLFHSEERHARLLLEGLESLGFTARLGVGPTIGAAWALARWGQKETKRRRDGETKCAEKRKTPAARSATSSLCLSVSPSLPSATSSLASLRPLPIHALRLEPATIAGLRELGIERIEHVLDLPRDGLVRRFGEEVIRRIDQLLGEAIELIEPVRPVAPASVQRQFDGPTTRLESVELAVRGLLDDLHDLLLEREAGVRVLDLELERLGVRAGEVVSETVVLGAPSRDVRHLWSMLRPRLERVQMGFGIEGARLTARHTGTLPHHQVERWRRAPTSRADEESGEQLADILANRLGRPHVTRLELLDAHLPERTFRHVEASLAEPTETSTPHLLERPSLLLDPPEPADAVALLPDRPPSWLRWRGVSGEVAGFGPERVGKNWWEEIKRRRDEETKGAEKRKHPAPSPTSSLRLSVSSSLSASSCLSTRDYFRVQQKDGLWLWVFRLNHHWFVHGVWA